MKEINLVMSGSGFNYPIYVGSYKALYEKGYRIKSVTGTSGGSIIAALLAVGYTEPDEIERVLMETIPSENKLVDLSWIPFRRHGLIKGTKILKVLDRILMGKTFKEAELDLNIVATNYNTGVWTLFNKANTPDVKISDAVRASISIPFVFAPHKIGEMWYVDGGIQNNWYVDLYGDTEETIALRCGSSEPSFEKIDFSIRGLYKYITRIVGLMLEGSISDRVEDVERVRKVWLASPYSFMAYNLTRLQVERLVDIGYYTTRKEVASDG
jgi:NTE family protein